MYNQCALFVIRDMPPLDLFTICERRCKAKHSDCDKNKAKQSGISEYRQAYNEKKNTKNNH